jgi:hypothetical protein
MGLADRAVVRDLLDGHGSRRNAFHPGARDPLDVLLAHLAFEQTLGVADPVETEVTDIGLGGDKRHGDAVAKFAAAQLGLQDEQEFVGRAEAGCALHGADHHRPRIGRQLLERLPRLGGVIDVADRLGMAVRPEPRNLVECEFRSSGHHQIVVVDRRAVREFDPVFARVHALRALGQQADTLSAHDVDKINLDIAALAPADRHPGIRGDEMIDRSLGDHRQAIVRS